MSTRRCAAALVLVAAMQAAGPAAAAEVAPAAGYWWLAQPDAGGVPAPSTVPAGGLYVGSGAAGATAVSAVRVPLLPGETAVGLVLKVHQAQQVDAIAVDAYPATKPWEPGDAQPWSQRPAYDDKAVPVHGSLQSAGTTLVFDLSTRALTGVVDLVLVPAAGSPVSPTFDLSLEPPAAGALTTASAPTDASPQPLFPSAPAGTGQTVTSPPLALTPPLPALGSVGIVQDAPAVAAPTPATVAQLPAATPVARRVVTGRSRRDTALLVFLLADVMFYLGWLSRGARTAPGGQRLSIYDLPSTSEA
jgi:hypothetical protein